MFKALVLAHRYLGIALGLLFVLWFASGIVMVFANDMPRVTEDMRLQRLAPLDLARVRISPADALTRAGLQHAEGRVTLSMLFDRPAYRIDGRTVFADTGDVLARVGPQDAQAIAARLVATAGAIPRWLFLTPLRVLTWVFSGFFSMEPWGWASGRGEVESAVTAALSGGPLELSQFPVLDATAVTSAAGAMPIRVIEFARIQDDAHSILRGGGQQLLAAADPLKVRQVPFPLESFLLRISAAVPGATVSDTRLQTQFDSYYYSREALPLPIVRMTLDDPQATWLYIDPATSRLVARIIKRDRLERWLYSGLHSLDFSFWYYRRGLWSAGVVALLSGGLMLSVIGTVIAVRRLRTARGGL